LTGSVSVVDRLRDDYGYFLQAVWPYLDKNNQAPLSEVELDAFVWAAQGAGDLSVFYANRSFGKSTGVTVPLTAWTWLRNADHKVKIVCKSKESAMLFLKGVRGLLEEVPFLQHLQPPESAWQADSATKIDVRGAVTRSVPSLYVVGGMGNKTGGRAHLIVADDLETPETIQTREARQRLFDRFVELQHLFFPSTEARSRMIVIGTYHSDQSVYCRLQDIGYELRAYPLLYPDDYERPLIRGLAPIIAKRLDAGTHKAGEIVCPLRYTPHYVAQEKAPGRTGFWQQHMGIARGSEGDQYPIQLRDFIVFNCTGAIGPVQLAHGEQAAGKATYRDDIEVDALAEDDGFHSPAFVSPDYAPWSRTHMRVDPAYGGKDKMAHAIGSTLGGNYFIRRVKGYKISNRTGKDTISLEKAAQAQAQDAKDLNARTCTVEKNSGGEAYAMVLQNAMNALKDDTWACSVTTLPSTGQKEVRMLDGAEGPIQLKRVVLDESVARNPSLQHQLTRLTRVRGCLDHEDEAEVVCALIADLKDNLRVDPEKARAKVRERRDADPDEKKPRWGDKYRQTA
jgi:hypothetical protein